LMSPLDAIPVAIIVKIGCAWVVNKYFVQGIYPDICKNTRNLQTMYLRCH
jgi:hypothetical protein